MAVPDGPQVEAFVTQLAARLQDVASQLYDLDQSASLTILEDLDKYAGRTKDVLADVAHDRTWLWPAYTMARERVDLAVSHVKERHYVDARKVLVRPLDLPEAPSHHDVPEAVTLISDTAKAVLDVALLVVPRIGEHLGALAGLRAQLGAIEEEAAGVGLSQASEVQAARQAVTDAFALVSTDPLSVDPSAATNAVKLAREVVAQGVAELQRLPKRLGLADTLLLEIEVLIGKGRVALDRTREKIARPTGLLVPLAPDALTGGPQALRPWLERLSRTAAEGDNRAVLMGMRSWDRFAQDLRAQAERVVIANEAPVRRRDELRGLVGALQAKAAASGLAEDPTAERLHQNAKQLLSVAPCDLDKAEKAVEEYRRFLADR